MWIAVTSQPIFAIAGFWQHTKDGNGLAMVTRPEQACRADPPNAMITILHPNDWDRWLSGSYADAVALQRLYPADQRTVSGPVFPTRGT